MKQVLLEHYYFAWIECQSTARFPPLHNISGLPHNSVERERVIVLHLLLIINDDAEDNNDNHNNNNKLIIIVIIS